MSRLAAAAFAEEIDRRAKIAELDAYLAALDAGGIRALTAQRARLIELRRRGLRPAPARPQRSPPPTPLSPPTPAPPVILTSDLAALAEHATHPITIAQV